MYNPEESGPLIPPKGRHTRETSYGSADVEGALGGRSSRSSSTGGEENVHFTPISSRAWSFQDQRRHMAGSDSPAAGMKLPHPHLPGQPEESSSSNKEGPQRFLYYLVYAAVNMIISAPSLYGYAAVIFNNPVFDTHMNALSKLVLFSSLVHQLGFLLFSSLDFAIGTVQDAGLIFLSSMANTIADIMVDDGHSEAEIVSTTLVLLCAGTALLGIVLIVMGKTGVADVVSFLPMPVVGGYLAFIGYFCFQAGVALCISTPLIELSDWLKVFHPKNMILATPGMIAGLILTYTSFKATNSAVLPAVMVAIPTAFYLVIWGTGIGLEGAREAGWVGEVAPSVPVTDLFKLVDFSLVRWDLWTEIVGTWVGMVFVVSFASCLDVAAISLDMGQALDTNRELATVGMCNCKYDDDMIMRIELSV
jgi:sulfate permease, SulP family